MKKDDIQHLIELFETKDINRIRIKEGEFELELEKYKECTIAAEPAPVCPAPAPINVQVVNDSKPIPTQNKKTLNAPMVGTFYSAPSPGSSPFVKVGQKVKKGDVIGIIEAMKIMNEIEAEYDCQIVESLVADGQPVEFDMALFGVEKL